MKEKLKRIIAVGLLGCSFYSFSQANDGGATSLNFKTASEINSKIKIPKSPEADAFEKYGNTPVSLYSGTPEISIPLHTLQGREIDVPITLTYDASGIKVNQIATNVGLGWNLTMGGRVSRVACGRPDDIGGGPYTYSDEILSHLDFLYQGGVSNFVDDFMMPIVNGQYDTQLDFYSLNVIGINDYIVRDLDSGAYHTLINPRIKIEFISGGWKVTGEEGTEYYFADATEITHLTGGSDAEGAGIMYNGDSISSWLLTKIISKNKLDVFEFSYQLYQWASAFKMSLSSISFEETKKCPIRLSGSGSFDVGRDYKTSQQMPLLIKRNGEVLADFKYKSRSDLTFTANPYMGGNALDQIRIYNFATSASTPNIYKKIRFEHSYFGNPNATLPTQRRLKLDNLYIFAGLEPQSKVYSFEYDRPENIPSITSLAQDFLGLFNGHENAHLVPSVLYGNWRTSGANRNFNPNTHTIGTLTKITYPTKGFTTFQYEQNEVPAPTYVPPHDYIQQLDITENHTLPYLGCYVGDEEIIPDEGLHTNMQFISPMNYPNHGSPQNTPIQYPCAPPRSVIMRIAEQTNLTIETEGTGVYLIQKITGCDPQQDIQPVCLDFNSPGQNLAVINVSPSNPCIRHGEDIFYDGTTSSNPSDFVAGGLTDAPISQLPNLPAGTYQVTLWPGGQPSESGFSFNGNSIRVYKEIPVHVPASYSNGTKKAEGFRIAAIEDYSQSGERAGRKEYRYSLSYNTVDPSGVQLGTAPEPKVYNTRWLACEGGGATCRSIPTVVVSSAGISTIPNVAYSSVFEISRDNADKIDGYVQSKYNVGITGIKYPESGVVSFEPKFENGKLAEKKVYDSNFQLKQKEVISYGEQPFFYGASLSFEKNHTNGYACSLDGENLNFVEGVCSYSALDLGPAAAGPPATFSQGYYQWTSNVLGKYNYVPVEQEIIGKYGFVSSKITTTYPSSGSEISKTETFNYDLLPPFMLQEKSYTTSDASQPIVEAYTYHEDFPENPEKVVETITQRGGTAIFTRKNVFEYFPITMGTAHLLTEIQTAKASEPLEPRMRFTYDSNTLSLTTVQQDVSNTADDSYDSYIYAYDDKLPVAKISGANYSGIPAALISNIKSASNQEVNLSTEANLRNALNALRAALPNAQVTTYTYNPVIGLTSQTDPKGIVTYYEYDEMGRLKAVKDNENHILTENKYNYRPATNP